MFFEISKEIVIKCDKCGKVNIIDKNDFDVNTFSSERQMGTDVTHEFSAESNCSECNNDFNCIVRVYEYPIGALNHTDNDCDGGIFIVAPQIETYNEEEIIEEKLEEKQMIEKLVELSDNRFKKVNVGYVRTENIVHMIVEGVYITFIHPIRHPLRENMIAEECVIIMFVNIHINICPNCIMLFVG